MDELYEAFCIQSRLREGASRMKQAFSSSPSTKGTKESIAEVNRRYKEYTEVHPPTHTPAALPCILAPGSLLAAGVVAGWPYRWQICRRSKMTKNTKAAVAVATHSLALLKLRAQQRAELM